MTEIAIPLRDGVLTTATLDLPAGDGPWPAVLLRTPYDRHAFAALGPLLTAAGYAAVVQDVRGKHGSGGAFTPFAHEGPDGADTIGWVAAQPWCDGQVAMIGDSYSGWAVWAAARERPPGLVCAVSAVTCGAFTAEWPWLDGVLWPGAIAWLHMLDGRGVRTLEDLGDDLSKPVLPIASLPDRLGGRLPMAEAWLASPTPGVAWAGLEVTAEDAAAIDVPVLHVTGWFDGCLRSTVRAHALLRAHSPAADRQALLIGAWDHAVGQARRDYAGHDFGPANALRLIDQRIAFLDHWMRGRGPRPAAVRVFATGADAWREPAAFPDPAATEVVVHLSADGVLVHGVPAPGEWSATLTYDPADPVMTTDPDRPTGFPSLDRRRVHARADVVTWAGPPAEAPVELTGAATATIWVSTDVPDTDVFVELVDLAPEGARFLIAHGARRTRWRDGLDRPERMMVPGVPEPVEVALTPRAHRLAAGHRLVVAVTSSGAPLWAPNPNVADPPHLARTWRTATTTVHTGPATPSRVVLPVVPTGSAQPWPVGEGAG